MAAVPYICAERVDEDGNALPKHIAPTGVDSFMPKGYRENARDFNLDARKKIEMIDEIRALGAACGDPWDDLGGAYG